MLVLWAHKSSTTDLCPLSTLLLWMREMLLCWTGFSRLTVLPRGAISLKYFIVIVKVSSDLEIWNDSKQNCICSTSLFQSLYARSRSLSRSQTHTQHTQMPMHTDTHAQTKLIHTSQAHTYTFCTNWSTHGWCNVSNSKPQVYTKQCGDSHIHLLVQERDISVHLPVLICREARAWLGASLASPRSPSWGSADPWGFFRNNQSLWQLKVALSRSTFWDIFFVNWCNF